ncbi:ABC transporter permease [Rhodopila sp.]|jgi:peptide/nickel transport system permease protein|uniref:ABC transporter permease n=1 Tax=Rhodopila sp. TaxID=2480087 RepID=UPI002C4366A4|nr:ABC transporter permease [Rhodopila sp.]HVZ06537.1 ABC transporter permease [Rhodopila sp.]
MAGVIAQRLVGSIPILLIVSLITFAMIHLIPGDPAAAIAGLSATGEQIANIRHDLGLDQPLPAQLAHWYLNLLHGDLGRSLLLGQPVLQATMQRLPVTVALSGYALVLTLVLGLVSGIVAALRQNSWIDQAAMIFAMLGISVPNFYLGLLMIILFAVRLGWLPTGGYVPLTQDPLGWLATSTMPAISLALLLTGLLARITRSTMLEVLRQDYIRTARAKGLPERRVVLRHALANALIPITTVIGIVISLLISGSVVTETLFSIPGIGQLLTQAVLNRDYPMVQGGLLITTALLVLVNIAVDVCYALLDPRVRY